MPVITVPPAFDEKKSYESWKNEVGIWRLVTDLDKKKQALAVTLSLTGRARDSALEIAAVDLNEDDGMTTLLTKLDSVFLKEETDRQYEAYTEIDRIARENGSLGIPIVPCALEISICQTVWWLWPVSLARICENVISNHRTRRDRKTMTRTMRQTEACSLFVRIQHGCSRSEALFRCSCGSSFSSQLVIYRRFVTPLDV